MSWCNRDGKEDVVLGRKALKYGSASIRRTTEPGNLPLLLGGIRESQRGCTALYARQDDRTRIHNRGTILLFDIPHHTPGATVTAGHAIISGL